MSPGRSLRLGHSTDEMTRAHGGSTKRQERVVMLLKIIEVDD